MAIVTVLELAIFRGAKESEDGGMTAGEVTRVGLPFLGGCQWCGACIAAYNAAPSQTGYLMCADGCIRDLGYETCEEANRALFPEEYQWVGVSDYAAAIGVEE